MYNFFCVFSRQDISDSVTPWTVAHQAPLSMGFPRREHWSGLPCPPPGDLPNPGIKLASLRSLALADGFFTTTATGKLLCPWNSPGKNTGVGYHFLLQGIFLTQGQTCISCISLYCQVDSLPLRHLQSPSLTVYCFL